MKKSEMKREAFPHTPYKRKAKGKEILPGYKSNPPRPRACVRMRYREARAAALELINILGGSAEKLYAAIEEAPLWQKLWMKNRLALKPRQRAILDALMIDWRSRPAAKIAGTDHKTVDASKKNFKTHFAQCYQAWQRDFAT